MGQVIVPPKGGGDEQPLEFLNCRTEPLELDHVDIQPGGYGRAYYKLAKSVIATQKSVVVVAVFSRDRPDVPGTYASIYVAALYHESSSDTIRSYGQNGVQFSMYDAPDLCSVDTAVGPAYWCDWNKGLISVGPLGDREHIEAAFIVYRK